MASSRYLSPQEQNRKARLAGKVCLYILCIFTAVICIFPFIALIITTTRNTIEILSGFSFAPGSSFFDNFRALFETLEDYDYSVIRAFFNSCIISIDSIISLQISVVKFSQKFLTKLFLTKTYQSTK